MSTYKIVAETFIRLANVVSFFEPNVTEEVKSKIHTIRLENKGGRGLAIVSNHKVASIENLGMTEFPDGVCHVKLTPELLAAAKRAADRGLPMTFTVMPEIALGAVQIGVGEFLNDACHWFDKTPLDDWRSWVLPAPEKSAGIMCWELYHVETLIRSSPSGKVVFPEMIDAQKPVTVRDRYRTGWIGVFLPSDILPPEMVKDIQGRSIPEWIV